MKLYNLFNFFLFNKKIDKRKDKTIYYFIFYRTEFVAIEKIEFYDINVVNINWIDTNIKFACYELYLTNYEYKKLLFMLLSEQIIFNISKQDFNSLDDYILDNFNLLKFRTYIPSLWLY